MVDRQGDATLERLGYAYQLVNAGRAARAEEERKAAEQEREAAARQAQQPPGTETVRVGRGRGGRSR